MSGKPPRQTNVVGPASPPRSWMSMLRTVRAAVGMIAFGLFIIVVPAQSTDMMEALNDGGAFAFHAALFLFGFSAWFWSRAALAARFGVPDNQRKRTSQGAEPFVDLPRLLFTVTALAGLYLTVRAWSPANALIVVAWWGVGVLYFWKRPHPGHRGEAPPSLVVSHNICDWLRHIPANFRALIWYAPFPNAFAGTVLVVNLLAFLLGAIGTYLPASVTWWPDWIAIFASWFPGPAIGILLMGLMIGPLAVLTFVSDGLRFRVRISGIDVGLKRPPVIIVSAVVVLYLLPLWFPLHTIRHIDGGMTPGQRAGLRAFVDDWPDRACPGGKARPVIVAISGGAMRAGIWGARIVDAIEENAGPDGPELFAISSVSGGSVGAATALAVLSGYRHTNGAPSCAERRGEGRAARLGFDRRAAPGLFASDSLGPVISGWLMGDLPRTILAPLAYLLRSDDWPPNGGDRAAAIEKSFERLWTESARPAGAPGLDQPFLSLSYDRSGAPVPGAPLWLANGTDARSGNRAITAPISAAAGASYNQWPFSAASDVLSLMGADVPISTAINNTARFPLLEPYGEVLSVAEHNHFRHRAIHGELIDGGYFENEGLQTALDLAHWIEAYDPTIKPIIVVATADGDSNVMIGDVVRCQNKVVPSPNVNPLETGATPQFSAPVLGLMNVRTGHSNVLLQKAAHAYCPASPGDEQRFFHFFLSGIGGDDRTKPHDVPLNWVLSKETVGQIWAQLNNGPIGNDAELTLLADELKKH